jgi:hypothetical protein
VVGLNDAVEDGLIVSNRALPPAASSSSHQAGYLRLDEIPITRISDRLRRRQGTSNAATGAGKVPAPGLP